MSDHRRDAGRRRRRTVRDAGMSLPEVLVATLILGMMTSALAMTTQLVIRQADNTEGRANNARSEQNVGMLMPADLASAEAVDVLPGTSPCGPTPACPPTISIDGSNAVMLSWNGQEFDASLNAVVATVTNVSYRVVQEDGEFRLRRVACRGQVGEELSCTSMVVLRELDPPPPDVEWFPGTTAPSWIISVTAASAPDAVDGAPTATTEPGFRNKNAQRVVVTINGGGDVDGAGGGRNQISLSAGGTNRQANLSTDDLVGAPTFTAARSRCGGNFGVVIDRSGSIGSTNMAAVRSGVNRLIDAFAGTPVKLQVVTFSSTATTLGAGSGWARYYDMLVDSDVAALRTAVNGVTHGGGTNWEDGFFRMLRNADGTVQAQLPSTVLFFTDGEPTWSRLDHTSATVAAVESPLDAGLPDSDGQGFSQVAWNRTERLLRDRGSINLVGVYVNPDLARSSTWLTRAGYHLVYERGDNVVFQQGSTIHERANNVVFQVSTDSDMRWERLVSGSWQSVSRSTFLASNTTPDSADGWRSRVISGGSISNGSSSWTTITEAQYHAANANNSISDGFRTTVNTAASSTPWVTVTPARFNASNTTADAADGWRTRLDGWTAVTEAAYLAGNTSAGEADGFRTTTSGTVSTWIGVPRSVFDASNTVGDATDGWRSRQVFEPPYDYFEDTVNEPLKNYAMIGNLVVGNTTGYEGGFVEAAPRGGPYTNAAAADLFVLPNYTNFGQALASVALGQCGGTVTVQTRVGTTPAQDPFTYLNSATNETVQTSAAYRSGTFDIALPGGGSTSVSISPQQFTNLVRYQPAGWSCRSGGQPYPFVEEPVPGHSPWTAIRLTVNPNQAVSCIQQVVFT